MQPGVCDPAACVRFHVVFFCVRFRVGVRLLGVRLLLVRFAKAGAGATHRYFFFCIPPCMHYTAICIGSFPWHV